MEVMAALAAELDDSSVRVMDAEHDLSRVFAHRSPVGGKQRFDCGFDLEPLEREIGSGRQRLRIPDRCYVGGHLGSGDPNDVCPQAARVFFWDTVHLSTFAHCWLAYFLRRELAEAGLLPKPPVPAAYQRLCEAGPHPLAGEPPR